MQSHSFRNVALIRYTRNYDLQKLWSEIQLSLFLSFSFLSFFIINALEIRCQAIASAIYICGKHFSEFLVKFIRSSRESITLKYLLVIFERHQLLSSGLPFFSICEPVLAYLLHSTSRMYSYLYQSGGAWLRIYYTVVYV